MTRTKRFAALAVIVFAAALVAALSAGCGGQGESETKPVVTIEGFTTLSDILNADNGAFYSHYNEDDYTCAFERDGNYYRAFAYMPAGM